MITVASVELPSTSTISSTSSVICSSTHATLRASFRTGMTRLTVIVGRLTAAVPASSGAQGPVL